MSRYHWIYQSFHSSLMNHCGSVSFVNNPMFWISKNKRFQQNKISFICLKANFKNKISRKKTKQWFFVLMFQEAWIQQLRSKEKWIWNLVWAKNKSKCSDSSWNQETRPNSIGIQDKTIKIKPLFPESNAYWAQ